MLTPDIKDKIKNHCLKDITKEACGLILSNGSVVPCENRASDSDVHFIIASKDIEKAQKKSKIIAVYHSHIQTKEEDDGLSGEDKVVSEYFNVCYVLYSIEKDMFYEYYPTGKPIEYEGRPYIRNVLDEFQLIKDYYKKELNIEVNDLRNKNPEIFLNKNGFIEISGAQKHDIIIVEKDNERKMMLMINNDKVLTHPEFQLSKITSYNYGLKRWTKKVFRHRKMM